MLFHFLNFSQCVVYMFRHKTIYKVTNLSPLQRDILRLKNPFSRTTTNSSFGLQSCFPLFVTSQIVNPAYWSSTGWQVEKNTWWSSACFKIETCAGVFISLYFWWKPIVFRKCYMSFLFHLSSCLIKLRLWADLCFVYSVTGETSLSATTKAPPTGWGWIYIYMRPQIVQVCGTMV